jgi:hypothetical protein
MAKVASEFPEVSDVIQRFNQIEAIQDEVRDHIVSIQGLFAQIAQTLGGARGGAVRGGRRGRRGGRLGRPPGRGKKPGRPAGVQARRGRKRGKRGALKKAIHQILSGGKIVRPVDMVNTLPKVGYRTASDPKVFYNTVYLALKNDKQIEKTAEGFRLKK